MRAGSAIGRSSSRSSVAKASMRSSRASRRPSLHILTRTRIASGPARTRTRSLRTCCVRRPSCERTCRRPRSARTTSARRSSRGRRAARVRSSTCTASLGALAGVEEGVELNFLGLTFGVDPLDLSLEAAAGGPVRLAARRAGRRRASGRGLACASSARCSRSPLRCCRSSCPRRTPSRGSSRSAGSSRRAMR